MIERSKSPRQVVSLRAYPLEDITIRADGDGRTVEAYAAMFNAPYEVHDWEGDYFERLSAACFDRSIAHGATRFQCLFNHGTTIYGTPSERYSMPLGAPVEVRAEKRGLLTVTRYAQTELADEVLELIRSGAIRAQSFRGRIISSRETGEMRSKLPVKERLEIALQDYGPVTFPVNMNAAILGVRSVDLAEQLADLSDEERAELFAQFSGTPLDPPDSQGDTPSADPPQGTPPAGPSVSMLSLAQEQRRRRT